MTRIALIASAVAFLLGFLFVLSARSSARRRRWSRAVTLGLAGLLFLSLSALGATAGVSIRGYRALTREELAATVRVYPLGPQKFRARVSTPDGEDHIFDIDGDALYLDARILKWKPWVNLIGLHTLYELDRIAGRYDALAEERSRPHTVFSLGAAKPIDLFELVRRFGQLTALVDADYGSATFVAARGVARYEIFVSTTGLLARRLDAGGAVPAARRTAGR